MSAPNKNRREESEKQGQKAERRVAAYLRMRGYKVLETRFKTPHGEVDVIGQKGKVLAFVEVKQRATQKAVDESMDWRSEQRIMTAAEVWVEQNFSNLPPNFEMRFDFAALIGAVSPLSRVHYLKNAFRPD